ncbi:flagellar hook-length control protein FliK [Actinoplanes campanulatus]|uniref:flagellar hook-length control protein FliK n=1 Tax=Actinoplanes campanulatus TaxID=113559 RepID=UPI0031CDE043
MTTPSSVTGPDRRLGTEIGRPPTGRRSGDGSDFGSALSNEMDRSADTSDQDRGGSRAGAGSADYQALMSRAAMSRAATERAAAATRAAAARTADSREAAQRAAVARAAERAADSREAAQRAAARTADSREAAAERAAATRAAERAADRRAVAGRNSPGRTTSERTSPNRTTDDRNTAEVTKQPATASSEPDQTSAEQEPKAGEPGSVAATAVVPVPVAIPAMPTEPPQADPASAGTDQVTALTGPAPAGQGGPTVPATTADADQAAVPGQGGPTVPATTADADQVAAPGRTTAEQAAVPANGLTGTATGAEAPALPRPESLRAGEAATQATADGTESAGSGLDTADAAVPTEPSSDTAPEQGSAGQGDQQPATDGRAGAPATGRAAAESATAFSTVLPQTAGPVEAGPAHPGAAGLPGMTGPQATAPTAQAPAPQAPPPATPSPYAAQLATRIIPLRLDADGVHRLTVHLHPADLGPVQVVAEIRNGDINVRLTGGTEAGTEALRQSLDDLRRQLNEAGFNNCSLDLRQGSAEQQARQQFAEHLGRRTDGGSRGGQDTAAEQPAPAPTRRADLGSGRLDTHV